MRCVLKCAIALVWALLLPSLAYAQGSIAGTVRDTSGAVLPGVTVEVASPALIEKVRSSVTDGNGRFQIIDLRPGTYSVSFSLPGFSTVRRDGVPLGGATTLTVDAEMRVGGLEETVTVTGAAATVDVASATRQTALSRDVVQELPTGRNYYNLGNLITGVSSTSQDVGGALGDTMSSLTTHGSKGVDQRITNNGLSIMTLQAGGNVGGNTPDVSSAQEITVDTSAVSAEMTTGGVRVNLIPRDGGNNFASSSFFTFSNDAMQVDNLTGKLRDLGLTAVNRNIRLFDINPAFGGPIKRDKFWFWMSGRYQGAESQAVGAYVNKNAYQLDKWLYEPDTTQEAHNDGVWHSLQLRGTIQANAKNKIAFTWQDQNYCRCPEYIGATIAPEAAPDRRFPNMKQQHVEWTSPLTSRILIEVVGMHLFERWGNMHKRVADGNFFKTGGSLVDPAQEAVMQQLIPVLEQSTGMLYRAGPAANGQVANNLYTNTLVPNFAYRGAVSYVTGTHNMKVGFNRTHGYLHVSNYQFQPYVYRFNNGVPNQVTVFATPYTVKSNQDNDLGLFVQDRYTRNRLTLSGGLRFDMFQTSYPEQHVGPAQLAPNRNITFPAQDNLDWKDITYRSAATLDVFGTGKTAVKVSLNKYLNGQTLNALGQDVSPVNTLVNSTTRSWNDANRNFVPDCVLDASVPGANGECGALANTDFGAVSTRPAATFSEDLTSGWGNRNYNWELSASVQHEIAPRVAVDIGYFRRWFGNFRVTDDLAVSAADFDTFSLTIPTDARLGDNSGQTITGLVNLKPAAFGRPTRNYNTLSDEYGKMTEHWNGVDFSMSARLQNGITLSGGVSTGRRTVNMCEIAAAIPEFLNGPTGVNLGDNNAGVWLPAAYCDQAEPWLTQAKLFGVYTIPAIDVLVSGTFQSVPGPLVAANLTATNAFLATNSTLGRTLSTGANMSVNIAAPGSLYAERLNQLDLRVGKIVRFGRAKANLSLDIYNALNADTVRQVNNSYASWTAAGFRPTSVLLARFMKVSATFDF